MNEISEAQGVRMAGQRDDNWYGDESTPGTAAVSPVEKALAHYGMTIEQSPEGFPKLSGANGISCAYSSQVFCEVVGMGAPDQTVFARWRRDGVAEVAIKGTVYVYDPAARGEDLDIPE